MKVLRKISKGPIVSEMKDAQIALGSEVAEFLLVSSKEEDAPPRVAALLNCIHFLTLRNYTK
jgi:hypothetical protein